jgi:dienelactone hydrolase
MRAMRVEAIEFPSAGGTCRGALYVPDSADGERPGVVVLAHGLSGTRLTQYDRRARRLVQDGVAVLDFDPRFVGTSPGEPRQRIDVFDWLADLRAAVAHIRSRDDVNAQRVGLYGSSSAAGWRLPLRGRIRGSRPLRSMFRL